MKLANPQTFEVSHENYGTIKYSHNLDPNNNVFSVLSATRSDGATGYAQIEVQDNGTLKIRVDEGPNNIFYTEVV